MATKQLKSIKFAGLGDTYILPEIDDTLSVEGMAADAKAVGDAIAAIEGGGGSGGSGSSVSFDANLNSGTKIGTITIDGAETDIYAPTDTNTTYTLAKSGTSIQLKNGSGTVISSVTDSNDNTTYSAATTSTAGLMSASDKSKLDGITASADSVSFNRSLTSGTKVGTLTINGTGTDLYAPNPNPSYVLDKTNSTATYLNYGASAVTSASYLAAWNGYELRAIAPSTVFKTIVTCGSGNYTFTYPEDDGAATVTTKTGTIAFTWKKYSDNTFELFGCSTAEIAVQCWYDWGSLYESGKIIINLPDLGWDINPYTHVTLIGNSDYSGCVWSEGLRLIDKTIHTFFCRPDSATAADVRLQVYMTGKYS